MRRARQHSGFTLIEVVVALTLFVAALVLVFGLVRSASRATERAEATAQRSERMRAVQGLLRSQLAAAMPMPMRVDAESGEAVFLVGEGSSVEFVGNMPGYLARGGPYWQRFDLVRGDKGLQLRFQFRQMTPDGPLDAERPPQVLLDGIRDASFEYRSLDDEMKPGPWTDEWTYRAMLPPLVRLKLRFEDETRLWPEFVSQLRLGSSYGYGPSPQAGDGFVPRQGDLTQ
ncbi:prepilin-type N-terminal cleavage/methylation domain-containing protein [Arenimonas sp.]|uniref:prepilin-type N-terminal cleavage/methylation domain-containing protein n=1 Tax=Arenimonas sp. TaxID=1872635 RepID=UPI0039E27148